MRVFLVDDAKVMRTRIAAIINSVKDVELVGQAVSIAEGTAGIAAMRPDVVVVDVDLTDGTGLVVLEFAKRRTPAPVVVVISAHAEPLYRERSLKSGADFFLDKGADLGELPLILQRLADRRPSERAPTQRPGHASDSTRRNL